MDIASILQVAAKEAKEEEREDADEALALAKQEITQEKNLGTLSYDLDSPRENASREMYENLDVKDDVNALFKDMNIQPKYVGSDLDDDVDALLRIKKDNNSKRKEEAQLRRRARYSFYFDIMLYYYY